MNCSRGNSDQYRRSDRGTSPTITEHDVHEKVSEVSQYNSPNREPPFVPGGYAMRILVPWKPVVLVWGLLSGMILVSFVASSLLEGKDPFGPPAVKTQAEQQAKHSHKAAQTPSR